MRNTVQEMVTCEKEEIHETVVVPEDLASRERDHLIEKKTGETKVERVTRLAYEEEFLKRNRQAAEKYLTDLMQENEGDPSMMLQMAQFYLRNGQLVKA